MVHSRYELLFYNTCMFPHAMPTVSSETPWENVITHTPPPTVFKHLYTQEDGMLFDFTSHVTNVKPDQQGGRKYRA